MSDTAVAVAVQAARLEFAFNGLPVSLLASVVLAAMTAMMLDSPTSRALLTTWFVTLAAVNGMRLLHYRSYRRDRARGNLNLATYDRRLQTGCLVGGIIWGSSAVLFLPGAPEMQFFLAFVIAGISSGAASSLSVAPGAAYAFVIPCVLPLTLRFLLAGDTLHAVMGIMTGFYMVLVSLVAHRGHQQLVRLVTARLAAQHSEAALKSSEGLRRISNERLRVATEAGQIGVWEWDLRSAELIWDERMYRMYRIDPSQGSGSFAMWRMRVHPADLARVEAALNEAIERRGEFKCEFRILWPEGEERTIKAAATVSRDPNGMPLRVTGINLDITELTRVERLKSEFVSVVSHELRTPLTSIRGSLGLVMSESTGTLAPPARDLLRLADRNAERLALLIEDLLDIEKLEAGTLRLDLRQQTLQPLVHQAIEMNRAYALQEGITLEMGSEQAPVPVEVHAQRIIQVLTKLLSNAIKFSPRGGTVSVCVERTAEDRVRVSVRDRGAGIAPIFRSRIFAKFSQCDASDTRLKGGAGLGLAISKALIEQMGGLIGFESPEGGGTIFFFELPVPAQPEYLSKHTREAPPDAPAVSATLSP